MEVGEEATHGMQSGNLMPAPLSEENFRSLSKLIHRECGIRMPVTKKIMLEARLRKRLKARGMTNFHDYCEYLFSAAGMADEMIPMIDVVTTNKTEFFREPRHFEYLTQAVLPELTKVHGAGIRRDLMVWSAGCATGEEPYTIAMVLNEFSETGLSLDFKILATDISTKALEKAVRAIYSQDEAETVPIALKRKYLMRSRDRRRGLVRIVPALRAKVRFRRLNFMEPDLGIQEPMDIIFCRNVIIYFDKPTQERLIQRLYSHLIPGGYLFMGHTETLSGFKVPLVSFGPMVYKKTL